MKAKILSTLVVAILASGCSVNSNSDYNNNPPTNYTSLQMQADAKILGGVAALDKTEIAAAVVAEKKTANPAVKNFAAFMYKQHSQNLQEAQAIGQKLNLTPMNGEVAKMLQRNGRKAIASLNHLQNGAFDRVYIADMVKGHTAALQLLNQKLIPLATNPLVKQLLENTRNHVIMHLQKAKAVQAQLAAH